MKALLAAAFLSSAPAWAARPITLAESYASALRRSEELAQRGESIAELEARAWELKAKIRPQLALLATETLQDVPPERSGVGSQFTQRNREQAQVTLTQPLFSGLREFLALRAMQARGRAAELALERARQLLFGDVAQAYVDVLSAQEESAVRRALVEITDERIKELESRRRLGRSRKSEVLAAQAQRAQIAADLETVSGRRRQTQLALRFLAGLEEDLEPRPLPPAGLGALEPWLKAAARRPDVEAARLESRAADLGEQVERRARWPALSLDGNYYLKRPPGFTDRVKWDAVFRAELPLYSGGGLSARAAAAAAAKRSSEQALELALRRARLETESAYSAAESAVSIAASLEKAEALAQANARAQAEDYRLGLVTNLDVLGSLNALQEARLKLAEARLTAALARLRLGVAAGSLEGLK